MDGVYPLAAYKHHKNLRDETEAMYGARITNTFYDVEPAYIVGGTVDPYAAPGIEYCLDRPDWSPAGGMQSFDILGYWNQLAVHIG